MHRRSFRIVSGMVSLGLALFLVFLVLYSFVVLHREKCSVPMEKKLIDGLVKLIVGWLAGQFRVVVGSW